MADVSVGHDQGVAADFGQSFAFDGAAADGNALTDFVVIADFETGRFAVVRNILGRHADGAERKERIVRADSAWTSNGNVRQQAAIFAQHDFSADHAVGTDAAGGRHFGLGIDDGRRMNVHEFIAFVGMREPAVREAILSFHSAAFSPALSVPSPRPRALSMSWHETVASATRLPAT